MFPEISAGIIALGFDPKFFEALPGTADIVESYGNGCLTTVEAVGMIVSQLR